MNSKYPVSKDQPILLFGAGLAGSLMAVYLAQRGHKVEVYERRPDMRKVDISAGKSINLALSVRGLHALRQVGMDQEILSISIPMPGRMIHDLEGNQDFQPYSKDPNKAINSVSRGDLNMRLMTRAEAHPNITFHFNQRCLGIDFEKKTAELRDEVTGREYAVSGQTILGADGAFSGVRKSLIFMPRVSFSQQYLDHGYKELTIPPNSDGSHRIAKNALHIWPRGKYMLIALPNLDGSFTVTLFLGFGGENGFDSLTTPEKVTAFFNQQFPDVVPHMPGLVNDFFENPTGTLVTIRTNPWSFEGAATLMGDACHAVVPFFGQGMNAAFEDCTELNACLDEFGDQGWDEVFAHYQQRRIANSNAIADMALDNYIEMRDLTADPDWVFRKKIEHKLEEHFPEKYLSRYEAVSFMRVPYAEAQTRHAINQKILLELAQGLDSPDQLDLTLAEKVIDKHYAL
ncbi:MAG: FAD-dependent monooxygenase [Bacteroidia bacterium]|nr:FAD-dependent monooxygenase [Bacteroidia bacterium]